MAASYQEHHEMDFYSDFCRRCGVSRIAIVDDRALPWCEQVDGEIAVMHIMAYRLFQPILDEVRRSLGWPQH